MKKWTVLVVFVALGWWWRQPHGVDVAADVKVQQGEYQITTLQDHFALTARVLSRENYRFGREAELSPVDLALGWGPMSELTTLSHFSIRQSGRWYYWRSSDLPIPARDVERNSANMHMIPANSHVAAQLSKIKQHQLIHIEGKLVRVDAADGWRWISSLSRDDTGNGACEVVLLEQISVLPD